MEDIKDIIKVLAFIIIVLGGLMLSACAGKGWSIMGYDIVPTEPGTFITIIDADSIQHIYKELNFDGFDYCLEHWEYETVHKIENE